MNSKILIIAAFMSFSAVASVNTYECFVGNSYSSGPIYWDLTINSLDKSINFINDGVVAKDQTRPADIKDNFIKYTNTECTSWGAQWGCLNAKLSGKRDPRTNKIIKAVSEDLFVSNFAYKRASKVFLILSRSYEDGSHDIRLNKCTLKF